MAEPSTPSPAATSPTGASPTGASPTGASPTGASPTGASPTAPARAGAPGAATTTGAGPGAPPHREGWRAVTVLRTLPAAAVLGAAVYLLTYVTGDFRDTQLATAGTYTVALAGLTVLTGVNGQISLGHGALLAVGAFTAALVAKHNPHLNLVVVLLAATAVAAVVGGLVGAAAARLRGPYLAGATIAFAVGLPGLLTHFTSVFGGDTGLLGPSTAPPASFGAGFSQFHWQAYVCGLAACVTIFLLANLLRSGIGRSWRAVRDDEVAAALAGLNVARWQVLAFIVSAACAGLAGGLLSVVVGTVTASAFPLALSLSLLTGIVIGGLGRLSGAILGGVALVFLPYWADGIGHSLHARTSVSANLAPALYGAILILVMLVAPGGIVGTALAVVHRVRQRRTARPAAAPAPAPAAAP